MSTHILSKSSYMQGRQCPKKLHFAKHRRDLLAPVDDQKQALFDVGTDIGLLAQQLFPGGIDMRPETPFDFAPSIEATQEAIRNGAHVIYEAAFAHDDVLAALDILVREGHGWKAYEVKSSGGVKPYHIADAALQAHVIEGSGLRLTDVGIIHVNTKYVRQGPIDVRQLFTIASVRKEIIEEQRSVPDRIRALKAMLAMGEEPQIAIGPHCTDPFECDFMHHCWKDLPELSVFDLNRGSKHKWEMYERGILKLQDIPLNEPLTASQQRQMNGLRYGTNTIDRGCIAAFLVTLKYPLYHFDFETFTTTVPLYDGSRPYQQVPFQYSVHIQESPTAEPDHREFLGDGTSDPREALVQQLIHDLGSEGDVLVYNITFERGKLNELARDLPHHRRALEAIIARLKDLMIPFQRGWYYVPAMNGRYSIKAVLPALVPGLSYTSLNVQEGGTASFLYSQLVQGLYKGDPQQLREDLLAYCALDTFAMVRLLEVLIKAASTNNRPQDHDPETE